MMLMMVMMNVVVVLGFVRSGGRHVNRIRGGKAEKEKEKKRSVKGKIEWLA